MPEVRTQRGSVIAFNDAIGFGDVQSNDDQRTYFFHCTQIADGTRTIDIGTTVTFRIVAGHMGRWEAVDVLPVANSAVATRDAGASEGGASFVCPVCTAPVAGEPGAYEICSVCGWEDDPVQRDDTGYAGGANTMSLEAARADWRRRQA